jgi:glycosyltransferase involved in cell wall biosynthesis
LVTVSFVVAAYNEGDVLGDCLDSILSQDYEDFEIIVVDDGSTDRTSDVAKTYVARSPKVRLATNGSNRGTGYTRNRGVSEANGKIVCFIDADSVLSKNWLRRTVDCFTEEEVSVLGGFDITHPQDAVFAQAVGLGLERGVTRFLKGRISEISGGSRSPEENAEIRSATPLQPRINRLSPKKRYCRRIFSTMLLFSS